jgi:primase-polymerase (primpol)-like protein
MAWHTVANVEYILTRAKQTPAEREQHLRNMLQQARVSPTDETDARHALDQGWRDFEDALQNYSAQQAAGVGIVITRNVNDYKTSSLSVKTPESFLRMLSSSE